MAVPRVVISGIGVVSAFGVGRERYWDHIRRGVSGTRAAAALSCVVTPCTTRAKANNPAMRTASLEAGRRAIGAG